MKNWYLIHTKIRQEFIALENLERQGFECFLPLIRSERLRGGVIHIVQEALFPRYLFIRLGTGFESQSWSPIRSTLGVNRLVTFGQIPAKIDDNFVAVMRSQWKESKAVKPLFEPGEQVLVTEGPFVDLKAIYQMTDGEGRVILLFNMLSKNVRMTASPDNVRKVH